VEITGSKLSEEQKAIYRQLASEPFALTQAEKIKEAETKAKTDYEKKLKQADEFGADGKITSNGEDQPDVASRTIRSNFHAGAVFCA
jgi:hypothetical protein